MSAELPSSPNLKLQKKLMRRRSFRESWPVLVWIAMVAIAIWAYKIGGQFHHMRGVVTKPTEVISPVFGGQLIPLGDLAPKDANGQSKVLAQGMRIEVGDVLAKLDDAGLKLEYEAEIQRIQMQNTDQSVDLWFQVEDAQNQLLQIKSTRQKVQDELAALIKQKVVVDREVERKIRPATDAAAIQTAIEEKVAEESELTRTSENREKAIVQGQTKIAELTAQAAVRADPNQSSELKLLQYKIDNTVIKARHSGYVEILHSAPGSVLKAGDPIITLLKDQSKTITALIPEENVSGMEVGTTVYVAHPNTPKEFETGAVLSLSPAMSQIPDFSSQVRGRMIRGRLVELGNMEGLAETLIPGSSVVITLEEPSTIPFLSWLLD